MNADYRYDNFRSRRTAAGLFGLLLSLIVLFSAFFIAAEAEHVHDCDEEDCPVCACVQLCENFLYHSDDGSAVQVIRFLPLSFLSLCVVLFAFHIVQDTPILKKVRLNN